MGANKTCDTCRYWVFAGQLESPDRAGNEGMCSALMLKGRDMSVPFWAEDLSRAVISWQGKSCLAWSKKPVRLVKVARKRK